MINSKNNMQLYGAMAEWLKAAVLKTVVLRGTGGSNPPCSVWSGARVAESGSLLRSCTLTGTEGSNPSYSAYDGRQKLACS